MEEQRNQEQMGPIENTPFVTCKIMQKPNSSVLK